MEGPKEKTNRQKRNKESKDGEEDVGRKGDGVRKYREA